MANAYRIPKHRVQVEVELPQRQLHSVEIFLAERAAGHAGPERPSDLFNGPDEFVVVSREGGEIEHLRRDHVVTVAVASAHELPGETESVAADLDEQVPVAVLLDDGRSIEGVTRYQLPGERRRLVDFLNHGERFLRLVRTDGVLLVNKQRIVRVRAA